MANMKQHKLGWIGIGRMGYAMAQLLARAGCDLSVWNRTRSKAEPLREHGAKVTTYYLSNVEQYLMRSGRTSFRGLVYDDLHRLQFDLETTGLNEERDRIFMISMRDSTGWRECLDTSALSETQLLERFGALDGRLRALLQLQVATLYDAAY